MSIASSHLMKSRGNRGVFARTGELKAKDVHERKKTMSSLVSSLCASIHRMEKVKFGVPLDQVCMSFNDIPAPLLILILKLNKEAPVKKDVFRAPGHQANMKKLITVLQTGRLVDIDNFNIYTIASVVKKFLSKIPGGIFGSVAEAKLFEISDCDDIDCKREEINKQITSLATVNQHLLVLLFGTFQSIASAAHGETNGMTSEALGISVAPSFFHSCISEGCKTAKMEDIQRYKVAISITKFLIDHFALCNLFGLSNYEYYARLTSRVLRIQNVHNNLISTYKYPYEVFLFIADESTPEKSSTTGEPVLPSTDERRDVNEFAARTGSLSSTAQVHEPRTQRLKI